MHQAHRLHLAFDGLSDELFDLRRRGSRIGTDQRRALDDEYGILFFTQREEAQGPSGDQANRKNQTTFLLCSEYSGRFMADSV